MLKELQSIEDIAFLAESTDGGRFTVNGVEGHFNTTAVYCSTPYYAGNEGFFHIRGTSGEILLLKSCYDDFVRVLKKGIKLTQNELAEVSRKLLQIEECTGFCEVYFVMDNMTFQVIYARRAAIEASEGEQVYMIPRPLTAAEYAQGQDGYSAGDTLFSRSYFNHTAPYPVSYLMESLINRYKDLLNPYFLLFDAKVRSPSAKVINGRLFANITNMLGGLKETRFPAEDFAAQYMPWQKLFTANKQVKAKQFVALHVTDDEIREFMDEVGQQSKYEGAHAIFDADYFNPAINIVMGLMLADNFFNECVNFYSKITGKTKEAVLNDVYKTRQNSFFATGKEMCAPKHFDPACTPHDFQIKPCFKPLEKQAVLNNMSGFARWRKGKKILTLLERIHLILDFRDALYVAGAAFHKKVNNILTEHGAFIAAKKRFKKEEEVFNFDLEDIRRLVNDTYYANMQPVLSYRKSYSCRVKAQEMPYEIYETDIPYAGLIVEEQFEKLFDKKTFDCKSINGKMLEGVADNKSIMCGALFGLADIAKFDEVAAVITETAPLSSYLTEYCIVSDTPLYYGVRYTEHLLNGRLLSISPQKIIKE